MPSSSMAAAVDGREWRRLPTSALGDGIRLFICVSTGRVVACVLRRGWPYVALCMGFGLVVKAKTEELGGPGPSSFYAWAPLNTRHLS